MKAMLAFVFFACGSSAPAGVDSAVPSDGETCSTTPTTPRTSAATSFIGPSDVQATIGNAIDGARRTLDVQMYLFTVRALSDKVIAAQSRGVAVRVILDPDEPGNATVRASFMSAGVPVRDAASVYEYAHAKYLVIDGQAAIIMSANLNADAMTMERNYGMTDGDSDDVADVQAIFDYDWALAAGAAVSAPDLSCTRLIVSPVNSGPRIEQLIGGADTSLDVEAFYISDVTVRAAIDSAKARGVSVRVILDNPTDQPGNDATKTQFTNVGIPVHYVSGQFLLHAKLIIADGVAFVGSENLSPTALTHNREVGALVFETSAAANIQQQFDADWANTPVAP